MAVVILTNECNLACPHCFRAAHVSREPEPWTLGELEDCLRELRAVGQSFLAYTGGEPGLWRDGRSGLAELLALTSESGFVAMFVTNGLPFRDQQTTSVLLDRYFALTGKPLYTVVSVDRWHEGTWTDSSSPAVDRVLEWRDLSARDPDLRIEIASIWSLDDSRNIPPGMLAKYADAGVNINYLPLSSLDVASALGQIAPQLCPRGTDKAGLGSYGEVLRQKRAISAEDWAGSDNSPLLGPCSALDTLTLDMERQYWLCNDRAGDSLRVASVGELSAESVAACLERNPVVASFRRTGFAETLHDCERGGGPLSADAAGLALEQSHPYGKSGRAACGLCRSLPRQAFL